jgi:hypothetical protein
MKNKINNKAILIVGAVFILVIIILIFFLVKFGSIYKSGLTNLVDQNKATEYTLRKTKIIKKITTLNNQDKSCIEITPEGIVRIYEVCGEKLTSANRLKDPKNIIRLVNIISSTEISNPGNTCLETQYEILIETDTGQEKICFDMENGRIQDGSNKGLIEDINQIIRDIVADMPDNSSVPSNTVFPNSSSNSYYLPTPEPSNGSIITSPLPSGSIQNLNPFTCEFSTNSGKRKPMNISNIICSNDPSPAP